MNNDKEELKISVPIITNQELEIFDYDIETNYQTIINQITKTISRDREIIILKRVIKKQDDKIKKLQKLLKEK